MTNRINSSSVHLTVDNLDWLRKTHEDNITWIPMFADYYYAYRAAEQQWWFVGKEKNSKLMQHQISNQRTNRC